MRRVVAIAGLLGLVAALLWIVRRDPSPTLDSADSADVDGRTPVPAAIDGPEAGRATSGGELRGQRSGAGTPSDSGPVVRSKAAGPRIRRTVVDEGGHPLAGATVELLGEPADTVPWDPESGAVLGVAQSDASGRVSIAVTGDMASSFFRVSIPGTHPALFWDDDWGKLLRMRPSTLVRGRVRVEGTDQPYEGAVVSASFPAKGNLPPLGPQRAVHSARDGTFALEVSERGIALLSARGPNALSDRIAVSLFSYEGSDVVLTLPDPGERGTAEGRVLLDDRPLAGVRVILGSTVSRSKPVVSEPTGADGVYRVGPVWSGVEEVSIDATGIGLGRSRLSASFEARDGRASHDFALLRPWSVSGRVTRRGAGVANATVSSSKWLRGREEGSTRTSTDASGTFRITGTFVRQKDVQVLVQAPEGDVMTLDVAFGDETWDVSGVVFELAPYGRMRGRVFDTDRAPIAGVRVKARNEVLTGPDGRFDVLTDPGRTRVTVACEGYLARTSAWTQVPEGDAGAEVNVTLETGGAVSGRVRDRAAAGLLGAQIRVVGADAIGGSSVAVVRDQDGTFASQIVAGTRFKVTVSMRGYVTQVIEGVEPDTYLPDIVLEREEKAPAPR